MYSHNSPLNIAYLNKQTPDTYNYCQKYCNIDCPSCLEYIKDMDELEKSMENDEHDHVQHEI